MASPYQDDDGGGARDGLRHLSVVNAEYAAGAYQRLVRKLAAAGYVESGGSRADVKAGDFKCLCPLHESVGEHYPSLHVTRTDDGGVKVNCHGGCANGDVFRLVMADDAVLAPCRAREVSAGAGRGGGGGGGFLLSGLELRSDAEAFRWYAQESSESGPWEAGSYVYRDTAGVQVAVKVKWTNKQFAWLSRSGGAGWRRGLGELNGRGVPLYRADEIVSASDGTVVWAVEGEKDADRLCEAGLLATSLNVGRQARGDLSAYRVLAGKRVVVVPDRDEVGMAAARRFALAAAAREVEAVEVRLMGPLGDESAGDGSGYDVSDWLDAGGLVTELEWLASQDEEVEVIDIGGVVDSGDGMVDADAGGDIAAAVTAGAEVSDDAEIWKFAVERDLLVPGVPFDAVRRSVAGRVASDIWTQFKVFKVGGGGDGDGDGSEVDLARYLDDDSEAGVAPPTLVRMEGKNGNALFYEGVLNTVFGLGGHGKTVMMIHCMAQLLMVDDSESAAHVAYYTYEYPVRSLVAALVAAGVPADRLKERLHVYQSHIGAPAKMLQQYPDVRLAVIDSTNKAMVAHGQDTDKVGGFGLLNNVMLRPMTDAGIAVVTVDHVTQNAETQDRPIGTVEKVNAVQGAMYKITCGQEFSRHRSGWSAIQMKKDNPSGTAWTKNDHVGYLMVHAGGLGEGRSRIWIQEDQPRPGQFGSEAVSSAGGSGMAGGDSSGSGSGSGGGGWASMMGAASAAQERQERAAQERHDREGAAWLLISEAGGEHSANSAADELAGRYSQYSKSTWQRTLKDMAERGRLKTDGGRHLWVTGDSRESGAESA